MLASVGAGSYRDVESACDAIIKTPSSDKPSESRLVCAEYYPRYRALYPALKSGFDALSQMRKMF